MSFNLVPTNFSENILYAFLILIFRFRIAWRGYHLNSIVSYLLIIKSAPQLLVWLVQLLGADQNDRTLYDYNFNISSASRARTRNCLRSAVPIPLLVPGNLTVNGLTARPLIWNS